MRRRCLVRSEREFAGHVPHRSSMHRRSRPGRCRRLRIGPGDHSLPWCGRRSSVAVGQGRRAISVRKGARQPHRFVGACRRGRVPDEQPQARWRTKRLSERSRDRRVLGGEHGDGIPAKARSALVSGRSLDRRIAGGTASAYLDPGRRRRGSRLRSLAVGAVPAAGNYSLALDRSGLRSCRVQPIPLLVARRVSRTVSRVRRRSRHRALGACRGTSCPKSRPRIARRPWPRAPRRSRWLRWP